MIGSPGARGEVVEVSLDVRVRSGQGPAVAVYPPGSTFGPRVADSCQFVWVLDGSCRWTCEGRSVEIRPGELLLVEEGMYDHFAWATDRTTRHGYVHFDVAPQADREPWPLVGSMAEPGNPLAGLCDYLLWLGAASSTHEQSRAHAVVSLMLSAFVEGPLPGRDESADLPDPVKPVVAMVGDAWASGTATAFTLAELAAAAGVSSRGLSRSFAQAYGVGPVRAFELLRLSRAEPMLVMGNIPMRIIARQCGFADAFHFSRRFRAAYGLPPQEFRRLGWGAVASPLETKGLLSLQRAMATPADRP